MEDGIIMGGGGDRAEETPKGQGISEMPKTPEIEAEEE